MEEEIARKIQQLSTLIIGREGEQLIGEKERHCPGLHNLQGIYGEWTVSDRLNDQQGHKSLRV